MAKKKTAPKKKATKNASPKKTAKKATPKQTRRQAEQVLRKGPIRTRPKAQALPGMEHMGQDAVLDRLCRSIGERRGTMADLRADDAGDMQAALNRMRVIGRAAYRQHGVELARVPGEEKLRVRTSRDEATAEVEEEPGDLEAMDAVDEGTGDRGATDIGNEDIDHDPAGDALDDDLNDDDGAATHF